MEHCGTACATTRAAATTQNYNTYRTRYVRTVYRPNMYTADPHDLLYVDATYVTQYVRAFATASLTGSWQDFLEGNKSGCDVNHTYYVQGVLHYDVLSS